MEMGIYITCVVHPTPYPTPNGLAQEPRRERWISYHICGAPVHSTVAHAGSPHSLGPLVDAAPRPAASGLQHHIKVRKVLRCR